MEKYRVDIVPPIEELLVQKLNQKKLSISTAESMTGGLISEMITSVSGSSNVFHEGYITYSNEIKEKVLSVKKETIDIEGVVSRAVALEMVKGLQNRTQSDICISVTGIAGPNTDERNTPVGTYYVGIYYHGQATVYSYSASGNRKQIRTEAANNALLEVYKLLQ